jgi:hypothetical protein
MPAFTPEQIEELTAVVGREIPRAYLDFIAAYPPALAGATYPGVPEGPADYELLADPAHVIGSNQMVRDEDIWTEEGPWDPAHLVIGEDIGGDLVSLHLDEPGLPVYRLLHEVGRYERTASSIEEHAAQLARLCRG